MEIPISRPLIGNEEKEAVIDCLKADRYSMGDKVREFEDKFAQYVGKRFGVMVNSGSSALLAMFAVFKHSNIALGKTIVCPPVGWSTDYSAMNLFGFKPSFVDLHSVTLKINQQSIETLLYDDKYKRKEAPEIAAIMPIHILGMPSYPSVLRKMADEYDVDLLEDCCESHGSIDNNRQVGSFGDMSVFSFFLSHILTSIEGGMVLTNSERTADMLRMFRAHGWTREVRWMQIDTSGIDKRFYFHVPGFNIRPTELNAVVALQQLKKLDGFITHRENVHNELNSFLAPYSKIRVYANDERVSWLGYPLLYDNRQLLTEHLEKNGIHTRPIASGDIRKHNMMNYIDYESNFAMPGTWDIHEKGFFINGHLADDEIDYVKKTFTKFFEGL